MDTKWNKIPNTRDDRYEWIQWFFSTMKKKKKNLFIDIRWEKNDETWLTIDDGV